MSLSIEAIVLLIDLQIKVTIWAIVSFAGGGLGEVEEGEEMEEVDKVEEGERQGGKEKNNMSHRQQADLG